MPDIGGGIVNITRSRIFSRRQHTLSGRYLAAGAGSLEYTHRDGIMTYLVGGIRTKSVVDISRNPAFQMVSLGFVSEVLACRLEVQLVCTCNPAAPEPMSVYRESHHSGGLSTPAYELLWVKERDAQALSLFRQDCRDDILGVLDLVS